MQASGPSLMQAASDEALLRDPQFEVLAVKVERVDAQGATHARPPAVTLKVLKGLRGRARKGPLRARGEPEPDPAATAETGAGLADPEAFSRWMAAPFAGPGQGESWIVLLQRYGDGSASIPHRCRFPDSPDNRKRIGKLARGSR